MSHNPMSSKKDTKKRSFVPVYGFILLVVFGGFSWVLAPYVYPIIADTGFDFPSEWTEPMRFGVVAFVIFVVLFGIGMILIAAFSGTITDPMDSRMSVKEMRKQGKIGGSGKRR